MTAVFVIVLGLVVAWLFVDAVLSVFERDAEPERMSSKWLARYRELEHEDEERVR